MKRVIFYSVALLMIGVIILLSATGHKDKLMVVGMIAAPLFLILLVVAVISGGVRHGMKGARNDAYRESTGKTARGFPIDPKR